VLQVSVLWRHSKYFVNTAVEISAYIFNIARLLSVPIIRFHVLELTKREVHGYAIGGLSGGEAKDDFWKMVAVSAASLPKNKSRYTMGIGFALDLVVCTALGSDMYDCVFPSRTAVSLHDISQIFEVITYLII